MGDEFIKTKSKSYKRRAEKLHAEEFGQRGISAGAPEKTTYVVRFTAPSVTPSPGDAIWLADIPGKAGVRVMHETTVIGEVDGPGSTKLRAVMAANPACSGMLPGVVAHAKDVSGYAKAKINF